MENEIIITSGCTVSNVNGHFGMVYAGPFPDQETALRASNYIHELLKKDWEDCKVKLKPKRPSFPDIKTLRQALKYQGDY